MAVTNSEALMQIQMAVIPAIKKITSWAGRVLQENQVLPKLLDPSAGE